MNLPTLIKKVSKISDGYAAAFNLERDDEWYILKLQEELGELIQSYMMMKGKARRKNKTDAELREDFEKEVADVMGQTLLLSDHFKVDLEKVIKEKWLIYEKKDK